MKHVHCIAADSLLCLNTWATRALIADINRRFHQAGLRLTMEQWRALSFLAERDGLTQNDLAALLLQEKTSVSRLLTGMQHRGYVVRAPYDRDGRCNRLVITEAGLEACRLGGVLASQALRLACRGVPREDMETCLRVLVQVIRNVRGDGLVAEIPG
ncbi:MAG: MarR family winged helix-turn-helix transcriptional regulator [Thermodesulfobacteriota bacterium]